MNENDRGTEIKKNVGMKKKIILLNVVEWEGTRIKTSNGSGWYKIWKSNVQVYMHTIIHNYTTLHDTTLHYITYRYIQYIPLHTSTYQYIPNHTIPYHIIPYHTNIRAYIHTCISMFNARMAKTQGDPEASFLSVARQPLYRFATKIRGNTFRRLLHFANIPATLTPGSQFQCKQMPNRSSTYREIVCTHTPILLESAYICTQKLSV